tara:strand:- start:1035 stop:1868 length:834 start_codon:yes stop_codon:yes gene_type:complete
MSDNEKSNEILLAMRKQLDGLYDDDYAMDIYEKLGNMEVDLDPDPLEYGPLRLNGKIARCRQYQQACQKHEIQLSQLSARLSSLLRQAEADYELQKGSLLMNDVTVRSGRSLPEREAFADRKLLKERRLIGDVKHAQESVTMLLRVTKAKKADLKDCSARIRDQYKIIQEAIACEGARWRNKKQPKVDLKPNEASSSVQVGKDPEQVLDSIVDTITQLQDEEETQETQDVSPKTNVIALRDDEMDGFLDDLLEDEDTSVTQKFNLSRAVGDLSARKF